MKEIKFHKDEKEYIKTVRLSKKENIQYPADLVYKFYVGEKGHQMWKKYKEFYFLSAKDNKINVDSSFQTFH